MTSARPKLCVLILSDALPGHVNQSRGLARWLDERFETRVEEHTVTLRLKPVARLLLTWLIKHGARSLALYRAFHRDTPPQASSLPQPVDLVVSTGGNTAFANVLLARHLRRPNAFLGSKRRLPGHCFTAHLTLEATGEPSNIVMNVAPSPRSARDMNARGRAFAAAHGLAGERLWLMACGGDGAGKTYAPKHWRALGGWMNDLAARHDVRWLVSTSRRTGRAAEQALRHALDPKSVAYGVWWHDREERILGDLLGAATHLFVTVDSMSMISECIAAGKPLTLVHTGDGQPNRRYRDALAKYERLSVCSNATTETRFDPAGMPPPPLSKLIGSQIDELAGRILRSNS